MTTLEEPSVSAQKESGLNGLFDQLAEKLSIRQQMVKRRMENIALHAALSVEDLLDLYCPITVPPEDWPRPWPSLPKDKEKKFWDERYKRRVQAQKEREDSAVRDPLVRLNTPRECLCGGSGYLTGAGMNFAMGHPDFGSIVACVCQLAKSKGRYRDWLWEQSGLKRDDPMLPGFGSYRETKFQQAAELKQAALEWSQGQSKTEWLVLWGAMGTGKTHLAKAACVAILGRDERVKYVNVLEFIAEGRRRLREDDGFDEWIAGIKSAPWLVLDDIGQEYRTEWTASVLREIIHYRYERSAPTLITTNFDRARLEQVLDPPTVDRMNDRRLCRSIEVQAPSQRGF